MVKENQRSRDNTANRTNSNTQRLAELMTELSETVIKLNTNMEYVQKDIGDIKLNLANKYVSDDVFSPIRVTQKDHELRIRRVEGWGLMAIGGLGLMEIIFTFFIK